ncbi:hypothetical protein [Streptomyces cavernicola]|uniref:Uncharacterized protein n=1 Tax=Streptomyces cavernicola TaxID=3043613 RepID=A0ABT6SC90_9ACTN|nr:hypothetical protein [Streptomyces sp. B-S-A6]MDI3405808.1 hypothetical protein [Streptomyces sp. B-S-A6]
MCVAPVLDLVEPTTCDTPELFSQTVPRTLVHRAAVSEVLVTGIRKVSEDHFPVGAQ